MNTEPEPRITTPQLLAAIDRYKDSTNVNPEVLGSCVYTDPENPNRHCLIGQVIVDLGYPALSYNDPGIAQTLPHWDSPETAMIAGRFQECADGTELGFSVDGPVRWNEAIAKAKFYLGLA